VSSGALALLIVAFMLPTGLGYVFIGVRRLARTHAARRPPLPDTMPIERLHADLRRLHDLLNATENANGITAKAFHCKATRAAYLDVLAKACRQLEVEPPTGHPVPESEIYRAESDLRRLGLDVRSVR
jgi:hypothetical protein